MYRIGEKVEFESYQKNPEKKYKTGEIIHMAITEGGTYWYIKDDETGLLHARKVHEIRKQVNHDAII